MKGKFEHLEWDSDFFGFDVYKISDQADPNDLKDDLEYLSKVKKANLVYYSSANKLENLDISDFYNVKLVDIKTTFVKRIDSNSPLSSKITTYKKEYPDEQLMRLAVESGIYSRFNVDPKIKSEKYEELYRLWITNSVNKKIAKEVLVFHVNHEVAGFVTLGEKNNRADIGIIAVDSSYRGRGIGKALMKAAEKWFSLHTPYKEIQVVTQETNAPANRLYQNLNYHAHSFLFFYHLWRKNL